MKYKLIVTKPITIAEDASNSVPTTSTEGRQTEGTQLRALNALSQSKTCDTQVGQSRLEIGDRSVADVVGAIKAVLGKDVTCTVLVPNKKRIGDVGLATIVVETGEKEVVITDTSEKQQEEEKEQKEEGKERKVECRFEGVTGSFNSTELRPWWEPRTCDWKEIVFYKLGRNRIANAKQREGGADEQNAMVILAGLNYLDFDRGRNMRVNGTVEQREGGERRRKSNNLRIKLETWSDSKMYACGCDWIAFLPFAGVQHGSFNTGEDHPWHQPLVVTTRNVTFEREYTEGEGVPKVAIWFNGLDVEKGKTHYKFQTWASGVSRKGFTINIASKDDTILWSAGVSWLSFPKGTKGIDSAKFNTTKELQGWEEKAETGKIDFKDAITDSIFVGLNELEAAGSANTRVKLDATTCNGEVTWEVGTWEDSVVSRAGGTVVVLGQ